MFLRVLRRVTAHYLGFEPYYLANFCDGQGADLSLSVYEIDPSERIRAKAEHRASLVSPPNMEGIGGADLSDIGEATVEESEGATLFAYANDRHRTIEFIDSVESRQYAQAAFEQSMRHSIATQDEVIGYAATKVTSGCKEWADLCRRPDKKEWTKRIEKAIVAISRSQSATRAAYRECSQGESISSEAGDGDPTGTMGSEEPV